MSIIKDPTLFQHLAIQGPVGIVLRDLVEKHWDSWETRFTALCSHSHYTAEQVFIQAVWSIGLYNNWYPWIEYRFGYGMCQEIFVLQQWLQELCLKSGFLKPVEKKIKTF